MTVLDWMRTEHRYALPGGGNALRFNAHEYAAFDCFILKRPGAEDEQTPEVMEKARAWYAAASESDKDRLFGNMAGLPGAFERYDLDTLREILARHAHLSADDLRANLKRFLEEDLSHRRRGRGRDVHPSRRSAAHHLRPAAHRHQCRGYRLHPWLRALARERADAVHRRAWRGGRDLPAIAQEFAGHIRFAHLRNVKNYPDGSFMEADHLDGDTDMVAVVRILLEANSARRKAAGEEHWRILPSRSRA